MSRRGLQRTAHQGTALGDVGTVADLFATVLRPTAKQRGLETWGQLAAYAAEEWVPSRIAFGKHKGRSIAEARTRFALAAKSTWLAYHKRYTAPVADLHPLPVLFFRTAADNEPVRAWLKDLAREERRIIGEDLKTLQFRWPLGMPLVRSLGDGLWELRSTLPTRIARCLFYVPGGRIVLLHGFIKKTQKTPPEDKALALKRKHAHTKAEKN